MSLLLLLQIFAGAAVQADVPPVPRLPFGPGEVLTYDARVGVFGRVGDATLRVEEASDVVGRDALRLSSSVRGGVAFLKVHDDTHSLVDAVTFATLAYEKHESSPLGSHDESVTVSLEHARWQADGTSHPLGGERPLDELSLLYWIRTLPLADGDGVVALDAAHFDARRNPIELRVLGRSTTRVPAGEFDVLELELRVRDPRRYDGVGRIRIQLTDDARRVPVRIRTSLPGSSTVTLELRTAVDGADGGAHAG